MSDAGEAGGPEERKVTSPALVWPGIAPGKDAAAPEDARLAARVAERAAERETVAACQRGDREAFDRLVQRYQREVYRLCYRYLGQHEDANDLAQEVFLRAWRSIGRFRGDSAFSTWLYRIAVNACLNHRALKRVPTQDLPEALPDPSRGAEARALDEDVARSVRGAIARLPEKQRATLVLKVYHDLSHEEVANVLGSSVGTVKSNLFHALGNLKRLLGGEPGR
ncbi:MAG: sigma-70 family RNA polymerase sigma factor [Vicinamibacteria bacterium]